MKINMDIVKQIENINFFERCGYNDRKSLQLNHGFRMIKSLDGIDDKYIRYGWDNVCLEAMNDIRSYLYDNNHDLYNHEWNPLVIEIKQDIMPHISEIISIKCLDTCFANRELLITRIKSDMIDIIVSGSMKEYYKSEFFEDMFSIYKSGHIPCGWIGSKIYGKFKIF